MRYQLLVPAFLLSSALAQPLLETHLSPSDLQVLEELVALALVSDAEVIAATVDLPLPLGDVLAIDVGASLHGDIYGQVQPSFSLTVRLDALALIDREQRVRQARLREAAASVRLRVLDAFVRYRITLEQAEIAALVLETAREHLRGTEIQYQAGTVIAADVFDARDRAALAASRLLQANTEIVITLEVLAAAVGSSLMSVLDLLGADQ